MNKKNVIKCTEVMPLKLTISRLSNIMLTYSCIRLLNIVIHSHGDFQFEGIHSTNETE